MVLYYHTIWSFIMSNPREKARIRLKRAGLTKKVTGRSGKNVAYNLAIFSAILRAKSVDFLIIFNNPHFFRLTRAKTANFRDYFLVGPGRFETHRRRIKILKRH